MFDFKDKVVLITGASGNLGSVLALEFAKAGASLVLSSRNVDSLQDVAQKLAAMQASYMLASLDVQDFKACQKAIDAALDKFAKIDFVVNNASDCLEGWDFSKISVDAIEREINTTYRSVVYMTKAVLAHFLERKQGVIANVSSVSAVSEGSCPLYSADKAAVIRFTETMQPHLASHNIKMTCVVPPNIRFENWVAEKGVSFKDVARIIMMQCIEGDNLAMPVVHLKPRRV